MKNKFLYILSPSYASYLQWKTILKDINDGENKIDILLPKPSSYKSMLPKLIDIFEEINCSHIYFYQNPLLSFFNSEKTTPSI